ncbi:AzlC family protein [Candidatus Halobonum tyrrellensis G22]|uniref:AzlC family protein n=1 Tax=Candidatus Halobonum tyrrellensis G22 TaxID=1324957 RepID=V4HF78_9EURY|nr:AzlC family protein [Candidatus Halobonum tyrrellensis G22]
MDARLPDEVRAGVRDTLPLLVGMVPFALVSGVAGTETGLTPLQTLGMSVLVFAGASQLAALDLLGRDAALGAVVLTAVVVNLRLLMYSASIAPHFRHLPARVRVGCAYLLTDPSYALSVARYAEAGAEPGDGTAERTREETTDEESGPRPPYYYLGVGGTLWVVWQVGTAAGVAFGAAVPDGWRLEFAVPLIFLALLVPALSDRPRLVAGGVAAAGATLGAGLPLNAGLLAGAAVGIAAGLTAETAGVGEPDADRREDVDRRAGADRRGDGNGREDADRWTEPEPESESGLPEDDR